MGENLLNNASTKKTPISNLHLWFTISVSQFYYKHNIFQEFVNRNLSGTPLHLLVLNKFYGIYKDLIFSITCICLLRGSFRIEVCIVFWSRHSMTSSDVVCFDRVAPRDFFTEWVSTAFIPHSIGLKIKSGQFFHNILRASNNHFFSQITGVLSKK